MSLTKPVENSYIRIGIHLGCGRTSIHGWKFFYPSRGDHRKLWPIDRYIQLGKLLHAQYSNIQLFITGTANEAFLGRQFSCSVPGVVNLIGRTSALELYEWINNSQCFITHDCGVLHIASATNTPLIGLFGPTNVAATGPYPLGDHHKIIKRPSMEEIKVNEVIAAVATVINATG